MKFVFLYFMLFLNVSLFGQIDFQLDTHKDNQIVDDYITTLSIDSIGYLWVGTTNGVIRYDGRDYDRFQNEGLEGAALNGNFVLDILARMDSSVWVSTYGGGISIYNPYKNNFITILSANDNSSILENRVTRMSNVSDNQVLINYRGVDQQSGGFSILDRYGILEKHFLNEVIQKNGDNVRFTDIATDKKYIWLPAQQLYQIDKNTLSYFTIEYPFPVEEWDDIRAIEKLDDSVLIIGYKNGLFTYDIIKKEWKTLLSDVRIKTMKSTRNKIYILSEKKIYILDKSQMNLTLFLKVKQKPKEIRINMIDIEIHGNDLWLGTNYGLYQFELEKQTVEVSKIESDYEKPIRVIRKISIPSDEIKNLYVAHGGQILEETETGKVKVINSVGYRVHGVISNFRKKDHYLFASNDGLFSYDYIRNTTASFIENSSLADTLKNEQIWSIYNNKKDSILWIGTKTKGLFKYDFGLDTFMNFKHESGNPLSLCFNRYLFKISLGLDGNLWISTDKGLSVINPETNRFVYYSKIMDLLDNYIVHHNVAGDRFMWIGTKDHGLYRYDIDNDEVKTFTIRDGLPFTGANRVFFERGTLFFSTVKGVCFLDEASSKIRLFDESAGIDHRDLYYSSLNIEDNMLHVSGGKSNKIYKIPIEDLSHGEDLGPTLIESISTSTSDTSITYFNPGNTINLTAQEDNIMMTFTTIDYDVRLIKYRYRLQGYDERWVSSGSARTANYSHLPGGSYQFILQASLAGGRWQQEQSINIDIDYYWYRTWWFYGLCMLGGLLLLGYLYKVSLDKIKLKKSYDLMLSQAEMKALRAQMNPHFLFNSLNSIKSFIIENDRKNASDYLNKFSKLMRLILNHSKSNLIPLSEEIQAIELYVDMEQLRFSSFCFEIEIDKNIPSGQLMVPPMILQPYLENAIWHGLQHKEFGSGKLLLQIYKMDDKGLHIVVRDNGVGREAATKLKSKSALQKKSHGMTITKERLELSHFESGKESVKIIDLFDGGVSTGTEIQIILPYTNSGNS